MVDDSFELACAILDEHPVVDGHNDLPWAHRLGHRYDLDAADLEAGLPGVRTDIPRLREGRVGAQFWSAYVPSTLPAVEAVTATLEQIDFIHEFTARYPHVFESAATAADVERAIAAGRIASLIGVEGGHSIATSLGTLRAFARLGVRYLTLTHNDNVAWADSATDEPKVGGLTAFGRVVVAEMNRLGMLVDLSHVAETTMRDALDATEAPVVFTHSSCRAIVDHPRNVPDDVLASLATNGGVCMVAPVPDFVSEDCRAWRMAMRAAGDGSKEGLERPTATIDQVVAHFDHAREVAGIDHVGVGGDYDGVDYFPVGLEDVSRYPVLFAALLDRGWSREDCAKVAGANVLRVLRDAEEVAARLQATTPPSQATIDEVDGAQVR